MSLRKLQEIIKDIYIHHDEKRGLEKTFKWFLSEIYELEEAIQKGDRNEIMVEISDVLAWLLSVANLLQVDIEEEFTNRYGDNCPKCGHKPCICPYRDMPDKDVKLVVNQSL